MEGMNQKAVHLNEVTANDFFSKFDTILSDCDGKQEKCSWPTVA